MVLGYEKLIALVRRNFNCGVTVRKIRKLSVVTGRGYSWRVSRVTGSRATTSSTSTPRAATSRWRASTASSTTARFTGTTPNGLPERVTDADGQTVWRGQFSTWGKTELKLSVPQWQVPQNLRFQGQYLDCESGLHYNLFRYYDPVTVRYTQMDTICYGADIERLHCVDS